MLRFGMGLGITLGANGLLGELGGGGETGNSGGGGGDGGQRSRGWQGETIEITGGAEASLAPSVVKVGVRCIFCMFNSVSKEQCPCRGYRLSSFRGAQVS